jgi:hypothetical protein
MRRHRPHNPWDLPTLRTIGAPYVKLEEEQRQQRARARQRMLRRVIFASGAVAAAAVAIVLVLAPGRSAQARSIVNEAPAAAEHAGSLAFASTLTIRVDGGSRPGIGEEGEIDFLTGDYKSTTRFQGTHQLSERRRVAGLVYASRGHLADRPGQQTRWDAAPVARWAPGGFAYESDAFTDPISIFRTLAHISAPVRRIRRQSIEGAPTTVYRLSTNLEAFLARNEGHVQDPAMYRRVAATLEVWIDGQGRPRQVVETFSAAGTSLRTVMRFHGYGLPVSVDAPAQNLVRSIGSAVKSNPLRSGPGSLLPRLLFFRPGGSGPSAHH